MRNGQTGGFSADWPLEVLSTVTFAEQEGKTTLTLHAIAQAQRAGGTAATLTLPSAQAYHTGEYTVVVSSEDARTMSWRSIGSS